jgi:hypothetical protein
MPLPEAKRPFTHIIMDRTLSDVVLPKDGFIAGKSDGFGIFERWILRLGYFFHRSQNPARAFDGDMTVIIYPSKSLPSGYVDAMTSYVKKGGKVLILESPENKTSVAPDLLKPFGLGLGATIEDGGELSIGPGWPKIKVTTSHEVTGGTPIMRIGDKPVAATASRGKGIVTVVGFGSRFSDANMGFSGDMDPDNDLRAVYGLDFELISSMIETRPMKVPTRPKPTTGPAAPAAPYPYIIPH